MTATNMCQISVVSGVVPLTSIGCGLSVVLPHQPKFIAMPLHCNNTVQLTCPSEFT